MCLCRGNGVYPDVTVGLNADAYATWFSHGDGIPGLRAVLTIPDEGKAPALRRPATYEGEYSTMFIVYTQPIR